MAVTELPRPRVRVILHSGLLNRSHIGSERVLGRGIRVEFAIYWPTCVRCSSSLFFPYNLTYFPFFVISYKAFLAEAEKDTPKH